MHLDPLIATKEGSLGSLEEGTDQVDDHFDLHLDFVLLLTRHLIKDLLEHLSVVHSRVLSLESLFLQCLNNLAHIGEQSEVHAEVVVLDLRKVHLLINVLFLLLVLRTRLVWIILFFLLFLATHE